MHAASPRDSRAQPENEVRDLRPTGGGERLVERLGDAELRGPVPKVGHVEVLRREHRHHVAELALGVRKGRPFQLRQNRVLRCGDEQLHPADDCRLASNRTPRD